MLQKCSVRKEFCAEKSLLINRLSPLGEIRQLHRKQFNNRRLYSDKGILSLFFYFCKNDKLVTNCHQLKSVTICHALIMLITCLLLVAFL